MVSSYLLRECRTEVEARADHTRRRHMENLRRLAERLGRSAKGNIHTSANPQRNKFGYQQADEAYAIRWALRLINPLEGEQQALDRITKPLEAAE